MLSYAEVKEHSGLTPFPQPFTQKHETTPRGQGNTKYQQIVKYMTKTITAQTNDWRSRGEVTDIFNVLRSSDLFKLV